VSAITGEHGLPLQNYTYSPFGTCLNVTNDPINSLQFIGRYGGYLDNDTGLTYFLHRWYDSKDGRWISRDPIGIGGGINLYAYVRNAPNLYLDRVGYGIVADIVCDGNGGFMVNYGIQFNTLDSSVQTCLRKHESVHLTQYMMNYKNSCKGKQMNALPDVGPNDALECGACSVERSCLQDELDKLKTDKCKDDPYKDKRRKIQEQLDLVNSRISQHCGK
jgi:RHS repeat-associated protein